MLKILLEKAFKKDIKKYKNNKKVEKIVNETIEKLLQNKPLEEKYKNHPLKGGWAPAFDCHIMPDVILIYQITKTELRLIRLGSHSDLFN